MPKFPPGPKDLVVNGRVVGQYIGTGDTELDLLLARARLRELGIEEKELPAWMHIRQQALDFQNTCALLLRSDFGRQATQRPFALIPYVVNTAFCVELYLKALASKYGKKLHGHQLLQLYKGLPKKAQEDIQLSIPDALKDAPVDGEIDVQAQMKAMNDVFVRWRYAYEYEQVGQVHMDELRFLRMLLFYACRNEVPRPIL